MSLFSRIAGDKAVERALLHSPETAPVREINGIRKSSRHSSSDDMKASREMLVDMAHLTHPVPDEILDAAVQGVERWGYLISPKNQSKRGTGQIELGIPYRSYDISLAALEAGGPIDIGQGITDSNNLYFPVIKDGEFEQWMRVAKTPNGWEAVGVGGSGNARLTEKFEDTHGLAHQDVVRTLLSSKELGMTFVALGNPGDPNPDSKTYYQLIQTLQDEPAGEPKTLSEAMDMMRRTASIYGSNRRTI
jgi:hypothetical protein